MNKPKESRSGGLFLSLILLVVLAGLAFAGWQSMRMKTAVAELESEINQLEEMANCTEAVSTAQFNQMSAIHAVGHLIEVAAPQLLEAKGRLGKNHPATSEFRRSLEYFQEVSDELLVATNASMLPESASEQCTLHPRLEELSGQVLVAQRLVVRTAIDLLVTAEIPVPPELQELLAQ